MKITIETSCGKVFENDINEMSDRQLAALLEQNGERTDVDPVQIAALRAELQRRQYSRSGSQNPEDEKGTYSTFRQLAEHRLVMTIHQSDPGFWRSDKFEETLASFLNKFNAAIDTDPKVAEVFNKPLPDDIWDDEPF